MGWSTGSSLFSDIITAINDCDIDDDTKKNLYEKLIPIFEDEDCDTLDECLGEDDIFDQVFNSLCPLDEEESDYLDFDDNDGC